MIIDNVLKGRRIAALTFEEKALLEGCFTETIEVAARTRVVAQGERIQKSTLLVEGFMGRYVDDKDGSRQLVAVHVPGDFVDLHAYPLKVLDHNVGTLSSSLIATMHHRSLDRIQFDYPALARKLWFLTLLDAALHRKWVFRLGRLKAISRIAHFLCETNARLMAVGHSDGTQFNFPITQNDLAEICGLTSIHVNRVLRQLRELSLCTFRASEVTIHNLNDLSTLGEFEPAYLYLTDPLSARAVHQEVYHARRL